MIQLPPTADAFMRFLLAVLPLAGWGCSTSESTVTPLPLDDHALWIADDRTHMVYRVTITDGMTLLTAAFESPAWSISGISLDPTTETLWGAEESRRFDKGRLVNFTKFGDELNSIGAASIDSSASEIEGVAFNLHDSTLWVVDDSSCRIFHLTVDGRSLGSFPCSTYDASATSPQEIDVDPSDQTLWLTDNVSKAIYNVRPNGHLISSFSTGLFDGQIRNVQGIAVDPSNGTLWITARDTGTIYNVDRDGTLIASFEVSRVVAAAGSPTGIAVERLFNENLGTAHQGPLGREDGSP